MAHKKWLSFINKIVPVNFPMGKFINGKNRDRGKTRGDTQGFNLIISLYDEKNPLRRDELISCLEKNLNHPLINRTHIFFERRKGGFSELYNYVSVKNNNIKIMEISERPDFRTFFDYANKVLKNENIIIANADVYFNDTLNRLKDYDFFKKFFVLTRWNMADDQKLYLQTKNNPTYPWKKIPENKLRKNQKLQNFKSADAWIFRSPLKLDFDCHYKVGTFRSDTLLNFSLLQKQSQGEFKVFNPCLSIKICHIDKNIGSKNLEKYLNDFEKNYPPDMLTKCKSAHINWCTLEDTYE